MPLPVQVDSDGAKPGQEAGTHFEPADCWNDLYDAFDQAELLIYIVGEAGGTASASHSHVTSWQEVGVLLTLAVCRALLSRDTRLCAPLIEYV